MFDCQHNEEYFTAECLDCDSAMAAGNPDNIPNMIRVVEAHVEKYGHRVRAYRGVSKGYEGSGGCGEREPYDEVVNYGPPAGEREL